MKFGCYEKKGTQRSEENTQKCVGANTTEIIGAMANELRGAAHGGIDFGGAVGEDKTTAHPDAVTKASCKRNRDDRPPFYRTHNAP